MDRRNKRRRFPKLGRKGKIICNLALALICLLAVWAGAGYPLPTAQMRLQRAARQQLLSGVEMGELLKLDSGERLVVGYGQDWVMLYEDQLPQGTVRCVRDWQSGGTLFPLEHDGSSWNKPVSRILTVDTPAGTTQAVLTVHIQAEVKVKRPGWGGPGAGSGGEINFDQEDVHNPEVLGTYVNMDEWYRAEGEPLEEGAFLFQLEKKYAAEDTEDWTELTWPEQYSFETLEYLEPERLRQDWLEVRLECSFLDEAGAELGRTTL